MSKSNKIYGVPPDVEKYNEAQMKYEAVRFISSYLCGILYLPRKPLKSQ